MPAPLLYSIWWVWRQFLLFSRMFVGVKLQICSLWSAAGHVLRSMCWHKDQIWEKSNTLFGLIEVVRNTKLLNNSVYLNPSTISGLSPSVWSTCVCHTPGEQRRWKNIRFVWLFHMNHLRTSSDCLNLLLVLVFYDENEWGEVCKFAIMQLINRPTNWNNSSSPYFP